MLLDFSGPVPKKKSKTIRKGRRGITISGEHVYEILTFSSALLKPGLKVRGLGAITGHERFAPGGTNRGFFTAFPESWLGAAERRIVIPAGRENSELLQTENQRDHFLW